MDEAYTWELWGIAYLANGGCSDDGCMDFRGSLIASGQSIFESALADAESLLALDETHLSEMFEEGFIYCGPVVYEELAGRQPQTDVKGKESPSGREWDESAQTLRQRFPRAWQRYSWAEPPATEQRVVKQPWWKLW